MADTSFRSGRRAWLMSAALASLAANRPVWGQSSVDRPLRVGFIRHYEPFSFPDSQAGLAGFDVDVCRRLCHVIGRPMQASASGLIQLTQSLHRQEIDWIGNQLLMTPDHRSHYDFVRPAYATTQLSCVQHESDARDFLSLDDLVGKRLGVLAGTGVEEKSRAALGKGVIGFERIEQGLQALALKKLDAVLEENLIAEYHIDKGRLPLKVAAPFAASIAMGLPVRKGDEAMRRQLSEAVTAILRDGSLRAISERWFGYDVSRPRASPAPS